MKLFALLLSVFLVGCSSNLPKSEISDRYSKLETMDHLTAKAAVLPSVPQIRVTPIDGKEYAVLDAEGMNQLNQFRKAAKQNTEAVSLLIEAQNGLIDQRNLMLQNLRLEESRSNFFAEKYTESENLRREQYDQFQMELLIHKVTLLLFGALVVF